ncbi:hypothetical protein EDD18DRAFT_1106943 [Armillaria luteobubalina]|uniref:Uncharacterized protein n=1 Tax=Armillaria luteobubalina TaxID=153913 RepID=A0AA39Q3Z7_9AGAR|nr:hypothetical protein EDD18DRAFT_1106943 [Armillaria luteobubalina]
MPSDYPVATQRGYWRTTRKLLIATMMCVGILPHRHSVQTETVNESVTLPSSEPGFITRLLSDDPNRKVVSAAEEKKVLILRVSIKLYPMYPAKKSRLRATPIPTSTAKST